VDRTFGRGQTGAHRGSGHQRLDPVEQEVKAEGDAPPVGDVVVERPGCQGGRDRGVTPGVGEQPQKRRVVEQGGVAEVLRTDRPGRTSRPRGGPAGRVAFLGSAREPLLSAALVGRALRRSWRTPDTHIMGIALPVMLMLMFVYVFGGAIGGDRPYVDYVVPGIILLCAGYGVRPTAGAGGWFATAALLGLYVLALTWVAVCIGLVASGPEAAAGFSFVIMLLPYVSSAFVVPSTMPRVLEVIATRQPVTPVADTVRAWLVGGPGADLGVALAWCVGVLLVGRVLAVLAVRRRSAG